VNLWESPASWASWIQQLIIIALGCLAFVRIKKYIDRKFEEVNRPKYKCRFQSKLVFIPQNETDDKLELDIETTEVVMPFPPFQRMTFRDCLSPLPPELAGTDEAKNHDFKEVACGLPVEEINWNNFTGRFTCRVAPIPIPVSKDNVQESLRDLEKLGWHLDGFSRIALRHRGVNLPDSW
jgi:hypothetical protein